MFRNDTEVTHMSGHSKWNNIKHKKEKSDAQKAKIFTKMGREIAVAAKTTLQRHALTICPTTT